MNEKFNNGQSMEMKVSAGAAGAGKVVTGGPLTTSMANQGSPFLLLNEIEQRVVKVRPMSTPVDQISRMVGSRRAGSMVVDYYTVDTKPTEATVKSITALTGSSAMHDGKPCYKLLTSNDELFAPTETILVPSQAGEHAKGEESMTRKALVLYVESRSADGVGLNVVAINPAVDGSGHPMTDLEEGTRLIRMGRAASELDVQTDQFEALPVKSSNYCQIFKAQVEQGTVMSLSNKEVGWSFTDQEEVAVMDMRMGMEKNFLFGSKARLSNRRSGNETLLTEGIWSQAKGVIELQEREMTHAGLVALMRRAFTGSAAGSTRKILIAGSGLIERINCLEPYRTVGGQEKVTRWGIDFSEIGSKFGTLYVVHSEVMDSCGHEDDGLILDPEYVTKYTFMPFGVEALDLRGSGVRNVQAMVITEASCLVLRHPQTHLRVIG
ncbi:MAG: DUF5309 domain-containing protein [Pseudoflavonifractor sp.]|nr:DUF5309 domain-containing protein [Alloprevotella sp.]MCM1117719.1 DUF5309 domain-containing protein [Pseudoflavonifractor sp.]